MTWTKNSNIKTSTSGICTTRVEVGQPVNGDQTIIAKPLSTLIYRLCIQKSTSLLQTLLVRLFAGCCLVSCYFHRSKADYEKDY